MPYSPWLASSLDAPTQDLHHAIEDRTGNVSLPAMRRKVLTVGLLMAIALSGMATLHAQASSGAFTAGETAQLKRGELVMRQEARRQGELQLIGGTSWQIIDLPADAVWSAVRDTDRYDRFVPELKQARLIEENGRQRMVAMRHESGPVEAKYTLKMRFTNDQKMAQFRLDRTRPHDIREGWGFFMVKPYGKKKSMLTFGVMADVGTGLVAGIVRSQVHEWMLRIPGQLKRYVEGSGRARYADATPAE